MVGAVISLCITASVAAADDPLPSWNDGATKQSIIEFVTKVTAEGGPDYVKPEERVATFDNDGTLWIEQPMYNQFVFALDEVKKQANQHPEWKDKEPFKSVLAGDMKAVAAMGEKGMLEIVAATHSGMTTVDFNNSVKQWLETAKHPRFKVPYTDDGPGKPEGINHFIGRQPIFAFGNSDGDKEMLEWTAFCQRLCFMGLVHHTDAVREYAYDRNSDVGKLDKALDEATAKGWTVVDMKNDWKTIFPAAKAAP